MRRNVWLAPITATMVLTACSEPSSEELTAASESAAAQEEWESGVPEISARYYGDGSRELFIEQSGSAYPSILQFCENGNLLSVSDGPYRDSDGDVEFVEDFEPCADGRLEPQEFPDTPVYVRE